MRRQVFGKEFLVGLVAILALSIGSGASAQRPEHGGTLTMLYADPTLNLDPHKDVGTSGLYVLNQILESLVGVDDEGKMVPMLAASMPQVLEGGKEYIFELRRGVKFQDGTDFTAEDVKFTFDRLLDPKVSTQAGRVKEFVEGATVLDKYKVKIRMVKPWVDFLTIMAHDKLFDIINPESVEKLGKDYGVKGVVGTGPFKFVEWVKGSGVKFEKNPNYWRKGLPYLDKLVFQEVLETATRELKFLSGEGDVLLDVPFKDIAELKRKKNITIYKAGSGLVVGIWFNTTQPPFDNRKVRQALSKATDRKAIVDSVYYGYGEPATSIFPSWSPGYSPGKDPYNPEEARKLLKEAGYSEANPLTLTLLIRNEKEYVDIATIVQAMWADEIGVKVKLEPVMPAGLFSMMLSVSPDYKIAVTRLAFGPPVTDYSYRMYSSKSYLNMTGYNKKGASNPKIDEMLSQAASELNDAIAKKLNEQISTTIFSEDVPIVTLCFPDNVDAAYDHVSNWKVISLDYLPRTTTWSSKQKK